jgi:hypothetical protein
MMYSLFSMQWASDLQDLVNSKLKEGWELHGPPFYGHDRLYQAMIIREETICKSQM